jgi:hypothetical protein
MAASTGLEFLEFRQSVIAIACIQCALEESFPVQAAASATSMNCIKASDQVPERNPKP